MKKILIITGVAFSTMVFGQIKTNLDIEQNASGALTPFLDASNFSESDDNDIPSNDGKGLVFPRVDLSALTQIAGPTRIGSTNAPTKYDGMVVYNTKEDVPAAIGGGENLKRGFYYYKNDGDGLQDGSWVRIADATDLQAGIASGHFWGVDGVTLEDNQYLGSKNAQNVVMKVNADKVGVEEPKKADYNPTKLILGNAGDESTFTKVIIGGTSVEQTEALKNRTKNIQPEGQTSQANFDFVLEVFGKARFSDGIVTKASTYPDYVFDNYFTGKSDVNPNYEFKKLDEVEDFIKENNHLPGVTSIKELTKSENGYNVDNTQLSIQTLEKVEELYLHVIEQQKEIQALKAEIAELKK